MARIPWNKGKIGVQICSEETRLKLSLSHMGNTNSLGFKHTDETKRKVSLASTGRTHICSEETKLKLSEYHKGLHPSEETRLKMCKSRKGRTPNLGNHHSEETKRKLSESLKGNTRSLGYKQTEETKKKKSEATKGKKWGNHKDETKFKMSLLKIGKYKGEENPNWQGGISVETHLIRTCSKTKIWRTAVYRRDYWTCQLCGKKKGIKLNAHHIKSFKKYPELRFEVSNGITYCKDCHYNNGFHKKELTA